MPESAIATHVDAPTRPSARPAAIASVAMAVPSTVVGNEQIAERLGIDPNWIVERTGVQQRRIAEPGEDLTALGALAGWEALARAGIHAIDVDLILAATMSHDRMTPNLAPLLAERLGSAAGALDIGAACTGFVGALALAVSQVESGRSRHALVVGAERLSPMLDPDDRGTAALFGDGAGAVVVGPASGAGIGPIVLGSDGAHSELVRCERDEALIRMEGQDTFRHAVARMSEAAADAAASAGVELADINAFVFHQANARILRTVGQRLGLDPERVIECISRYGNTSAASIPIALAVAEADGRIKPGDKVLLCAFGGGLTWGATVLEWEARDAT